MMKYPHFIKKGDCIGLVAPSLGCPIDPYKIRLENGMNNFKKLGINFLNGDYIYSIEKGESSSPLNRALEFMNMYKNKNTDFIYSVAGGEIMYLILQHIDFEKIKTLPVKYFMGYSDNTVLTYTLTTICDIASIYGIHLGDFSSFPFTDEVNASWDLMTGKKLCFPSFSKYELSDLKDVDPCAPYNLTEDVCWINLLDNKNCDFTGRIIGGCLEVLEYICGSPYDKTVSFIEKYKDDGIIFYLDIFSSTSLQVKIILQKFKENGWFKYIKGFVIGRVCIPNVIFEVTYEEAIFDMLADYNVPLIFNADVGHLQPSIPIINGAIATVKYFDSKGSITFNLK